MDYFTCAGHRGRSEKRKRVRLAQVFWPERCLWRHLLSPNHLQVEVTLADGCPLAEEEAEGQAWACSPESRAWRHLLPASLRLLQLILQLRGQRPWTAPVP